MRARRFETPRRGRTSSQDINDFQDLVVGDLAELDTEVTSNTNQIAQNMQIMAAEVRQLQEEVERLKKKVTVENSIAGDSSDELFFLQDFRRIDNLNYGSGTTLVPDTRKLRIDTEYGQATVPYNNLFERLFYLSTSSDEVVTYPDVSATVTAVDEGSGTVVSGTPTNAVNGINESYWIRSVKFPAQSDVASVQCRYKVSIPASKIMKSNTLVIHPYPLGIVDIVSIEYTIDDTESWIEFNDSASDTLYPTTSFPMNSCPALRFVFPPIEITKLRITLRQRNHTTRNGYKTFQYGLQEVSLRYTDFEKYGATSLYNDTQNPAPKNVNTAYVEVKAPTSKTFANLTGFWAAPGYDTSGGVVGGEGSYGWPIRYRIYSDSSLTNLVWDSYNDRLPQDLAVSLTSLSVSTIYVAVSAAFDTSKTVPPVLDYFALKYTVES